MRYFTYFLIFCLLNHFSDSILDGDGDKNEECEIFTGQDDPSTENLMIAIYPQNLDNVTLINVKSFIESWLQLYKGGKANFAFAFVECTESQKCQTTFTEPSKVVKRSCSSIDWFEADEGFSFLHCIVIHPTVLTVLSTIDATNLDCGRVQEDRCAILEDFLHRFQPVIRTNLTEYTFLSNLKDQIPLITKNRLDLTTVIFFAPYNETVVADLSTDPKIKALIDSYQTFVMISIKEPNTTMIYAPSPNSSTRSKELCVDMSDLTKNSVDVGQAIIQATQGIVPDRFKCFADSTTGSASSTTSTSKATTKAFTTNMITTTNNMGTTGGIIETTTEASQTTENMQTSSESTETTSTSTRNDETTTTTSTSCYGVQPNECSCEPTSLWNDLVVVIDRSNEIGEKDFDATVSAIKTILFGTSIGQRDENETQLGVVLYDLKAQLVADLTEYKNRDDMMKAKWPYSGGDGTNLADGLDMAIDILAADMRSASRQVILLITSVYHWQDGFEDPIKAATGFKDDGGLIITLGIGGLHGKVNETLRNVSSPGFFIQLKSINSLTENTTRDEIYRLFCDANCFCPGQLDEITEDRFSPVSTTQRESVPDGGCFFDSSLPSSQILVERTCKTMEVAVNKSMTAMPKYSNQQAHILRAQQFNITYWVALNSTNGFWKWNDGTAFCGAEVQFDDKSPADAHYAVLQWTDDGAIVFKARDLDASAFFACQAPPCSSKNYCKPKGNRRKYRRRERL